MNILRHLPLLLAILACSCSAKAADYFPPLDRDGGWRGLESGEDIRRVAGMDRQQLDAAFNYIQGSTKNGGLLVLRGGWLVYENYFGLGHREATPNLGSCGKSITSIAVGILMGERPELFPDGLDQRIFTPGFLPPEAFPLTDPRKHEIKLGQLLAFSAGIRGNNPGFVHGRRVTLDPAGPDGWQSMVDAAALGIRDFPDREGRPLSTRTLWCEPGGGYSYASSSIHLASMMLRHVTGMELEEYVKDRLAAPLGWGRWGWGYKYASQVTHTPGAGGIALRATDMLRFGYLLLHEGRWQERQIVPAEYVRHASRESPYNPHFPYSLQFDVNSGGQIPGVPRDAFWKSGSGGHVLYVVPSLDLVIWKLGGRDGQYSEQDTGVPMHAAAAREARPREGWSETVDAETARVRTLQTVVGAVVEREPVQTSRPARLPPRTVPIGRGGSDGFLAVGPDGTIHVIYGGKYRSGRSADGLGAEERIAGEAPVHGVRMTLDSAGRPHVVFSNGAAGRATRSYYTARIGGQWLKPERFATLTQFSNVQNEGAEFHVTSGITIAAGNVRERFEGPVGVWASLDRGHGFGW